jgi:FkbM family methyltransferase
MKILRKLLAAVSGGDGWHRKRRRSGTDSLYVGDNTLLIRTRRNNLIYADSRDVTIVPQLAFRRSWEPWVTKAMERALKPGMNAADAGAHIGYHACIMARLIGPGGQLDVIEANPRLVQLLRKTMAANGFHRRARCHEAILSDRAGEADFHIFENFLAASSVLPMQATAESFGDTVHVVRLRSARLDELVAGERLDALKIDCEGSEPAVIAGARRFLENGSLKHIFMEYSPHFYKDRAVPERMFADLERYGFRFAMIQPESAPRPMTRGEVLALPTLADLYLARG